MRKSIGLSTFNLQNIYGDKRALEIAKEIGADAVDFDLSSNNVIDKDSVYRKSDEEIIEYYKDIKNYADKIGIEICQTHGRLRVFWGEEEKNTNAIKEARLDCLATKALGAPYCVMHSIATSITGPGADEKFMQNTFDDVFSKIITFAKEYNIKIAIETMGDSPIYGCCDFFGNLFEFKKSFDRLSAVNDNAKYLCTCIDTGHVNKAMRFNNNPTPAKFIREMGSSVKCLHLNDNNTLTDQHKPPKTGIIDWDDVLGALDEIGYDGVYNLELNLQHFGKGFEIETARFSVQLMNFLINK